MKTNSSLKVLKPAVAAALAIVICASFAHADTIIDGTFNFTVTSGSPAPTGSFMWDSTTSTWNSFTVDWDGAVFNFAPLFPNLAVLATSGSWDAAGPANVTDPITPPGNFNLNGVPTGSEFGTFTDFVAGANGTYTVTESRTVPDTGSTFGLLSLSLIALLGATRLRFLQLAA
jgi:hypothetical protein